MSTKCVNLWIAVGNLVIDVEGVNPQTGKKIVKMISYSVGEVLPADVGADTIKHLREVGLIREVAVPLPKEGSR